MARVGLVSNVEFLIPRETAVIDRAKLARLGRTMGRDAAARIAERAIEEVAERICAIELAWRTSDFVRLGKTARALIAISEQIGMVGVAEVSTDICTTLANRDEAALAAVVSRLVRVGDHSLGTAATGEFLSS